VLPFECFVDIFQHKLKSESSYAFQATITDFSYQGLHPPSV